MKNKLILLALIITCVLSLFSCGDKPSLEITENNGSEAAPFSDYTIIYSNKATEKETQAFQSLNAAFSEIGISLPSSSDLEMPDIGVVRQDKEIVVGTTNRYEGDITLKPKEFMIDHSSSRIYIMGGSDDSTIEAVEYFITNYIKDGKISITEGDSYVKTHAYPQLLINGTDVSAYVIEYNTEEEKEKGEVLSEAIYELYGVKLPVLYTHESERVIKMKIDPVSYKASYSIQNKGDNFIIAAASKYGLQYAIDYMKESLFIIDDSLQTLVPEKYVAESIYPENIMSLKDNVTTNFYIMADTEKSPVSYKVGEEMIFNITAYDGKNPISCPGVKYTLKTDDGQDKTGTLSLEKGSATLSVTLTKPGVVSLSISAVDEDGKQLDKVTPFEGGAVANIAEITVAKEAPADFEEFWRAQLKRLYDSDPTDATVPTTDTVYKGSVKTEYQMEYKNYYHVKKLTVDDVPTLKASGISISESSFNSVDIYEVYLKTPGPTPAAGYLCVPKNAAPNSLHATISFHGYGASTAKPHPNTGEITFNVTHHGYENGQPESYYKTLQSGVCANYGRGNGKINSGYENREDCYILYMFLRDMQALRFISDESVNSDIANLSKYWNGKVYITGTSMGGYQTIGVTSLANFIPEDKKTFEIVKSSATVPAWCNLGGKTIDGRLGNRFGIYYEENMDYFDCAILGGFITTNVEIPRCGLGDYTCPPSGIIAMYNNLKGKKFISFYQNSTHEPPTNYKYYDFDGELK